MVYFDNNATTPLGQNALQVYRLALEHDWSNPSSPYRSASRVRAKLEQAREELASILGFHKDQLIFTSGATEANNSVFAHVASNEKKEGQCLLSPFEHPSIIEPAKYWFKDRLTYMPTDDSGRVDLDRTEQLLNTENISLVSLMAANNETGVIQPWQELAKLCLNQGIFFHCDATQWIGKLDSSAFSLCTSFSASAHKFSGPKGLGWLACKEPIQLQLGGQQERESRGGTENYPAIASMLVALKDAIKDLDGLIQGAEWRDQFEQSIINAIPETIVLGKESPRLWNTSMILLPKFNNLSWVGKLDKRGISVSTGSACSAGNVKNTSLVFSMGLSSNEAGRLVRVSSYSDQNESDWQNLALAFTDVFKELKDEASHSSVISL
ncbi:aminotransferase class V-fold PLP-dependent enzyme [Opitutales bacterium]|jgi:cysteine desulfurase|nr:aminotransferase class V-fold PLP-dependent enzyme [Opitutales bacterium]